jgi:hypothetical protein
MNATIFTAYGKVLQHMDKKEALSHWWAGCAAGIAQTAIISPVELIKEMVYLRIYGLYKNYCFIYIFHRWIIFTFYSFHGK